MNADGTEPGGGESPGSTRAGSTGTGTGTGAGRLILPKPTAGLKRAPSGMSRTMLSTHGDSDHAGATGATPDYDPYGDGASNRSSPEILMRNDPTIAGAMQIRTGSGIGVGGVPGNRPKPVLTGAQGQYIVPKLPAQVDELGHPVYQNSILTRGISILRIPDYSGVKVRCHLGCGVQRPLMPCYRPRRES